MPDVGWPELLIILVVALVIFGPKRLPDLGKSLGKGIREFKNGINGLHEHLDDETEADGAKQVASRATVPDARADAEVVTGEVVHEETVQTQSETRATA
jgi:sec-independent protein translocase protein TatA